jgi:hypothetical protein
MTPETLTPSRPVPFLGTDEHRWVLRRLNSAIGSRRNILNWEVGQLNTPAATHGLSPNVHELGVNYE